MSTELTIIKKRIANGERAVDVVREVLNCDRGGAVMWLKTHGFEYRKAWYHNGRKVAR